MSTLPKLAEGQSWACGNGCGECDIKEAMFEYSRTEHPNGDVETKSQRIYVSKCCGSDLMLWNETKQDFEDWACVEQATPPSPSTASEVSEKHIDILHALRIHFKAHSPSFFVTGSIRADEVVEAISSTLASKPVAREVEQNPYPHRLEKFADLRKGTGWMECRCGAKGPVLPDSQCPAAIKEARAASQSNDRQATVKQGAEVDVEAERKLFEAEFEAWWQAHGQYCRAGGGDYEKTFAYRAAEYFARRTQVPAQTGSGEEGKDAASTAAEENERIAELFHRTYEELAPSFGYETRPESRKPWHEVPKANRLLMTAVVAKVRTALAYRYPQEGDRQVDRGERYRVHPVGELFEPQMRYCAGATGEWFWAPLNKDGYWLEPECFSYGKVTKHEPMTYEEAERAVVCARRINEEQLLSLAAIAATQSEEQRG